SCIIHGNNGLILNVSYNPSKDLALAVTQQGENKTADIEEELIILYKSITDPNLFNAFVSDIVDPEREKILAEIRQDEMIGEKPTDEEMSTLNIFDAETINSLVNEILTVSRNYGANQISVGYLRKRMKLPSEVLHVALEYLISTGAIIGRIGREKLSGKEILVLQSYSQITDDEKQIIKNVQGQIKDLFLPIDGYLKQIPTLVKISDKPEISEALSEFQVLQSLSDTDSLFLLTADLRIIGGQLERSAKTITMLQEQVAENIGNEKFLQELKTRLDQQIERFTNLRSTITTASNKLYTDILNAYRILLKIIPIPNIIKYNSTIDKYSLLFKCGVIGCQQFLYYYDDDVNRWKQIIYFGKILDLIDSYPEGWNKDNLEIDQTFIKLRSIARSEEEDTTLDTFTFLNDLDNLIISNVRRDSIITDLRKKVYNQSNDQIDYYSFFRQCNKCSKWYCQKHIKPDDNKCVYC
ncbi:MAG: hypothetical protein KAT16_07865, partial [Candidatus Heimdallarchaeota archaeon]|nr:hypothetical protein [Candidatus Heimdallarchaeota archaeon]